jgi:hypothetical protein
MDNISSLISSIVNRIAKQPLSPNEYLYINNIPVQFAELPKQFYKEYMGFASYFYSVVQLT